jgi:uncharacterized protein (TIGR00730 family)
LIRRVCIFCGSNRGRDARYAAAARSLAAVLVAQKIGVVYGGGAVGLMGDLADAVIEAGGEIVGVIPSALWDREIGHRGLTKMHVVDTMHQRKALMADLADAFIALPGGLGTYEEIFEVWTWAQLGLHQKPCGFVDAAGFYSSLFAFLDSAVKAGFIRPEHRAMAIVDDDPARLLEKLREYAPPGVEKWIRHGEE